jgi:hypothetical protein
MKLVSIIQKEKQPFVAARMKLFVASDYVEDNELAESCRVTLSGRSESVIKTMPRSGKNWRANFFVARYRDTLSSDKIKICT